MKHLCLALALLVGTAVPVSSLEPAGELKFEIFKDARKEYRWRLRAANGKVIGMADEGYARKEGCQHAIQLIKDGAAKASVEDLSTTSD